jgi:hypothetical protein
MAVADISPTMPFMTLMTRGGPGRVFALSWSWFPPAWLFLPFPFAGQDFFFLFEDSVAV